MRNIFRTLLAASSLLSCTLARADVVADWNAIALNAVESSAVHSTNALRAVAGVHIAMFEAMNFIEGRYVPRFLIKPPTPIAASSEAAAAAAAHHVLVHLYPEQSAAFDAALDRSLAQIPEGTRKSSGRITGKAIGANVYAIWASEQASNRVQASQVGSVSEPLIWNLIAAKLVDASRLEPIDAARVHAVVSIAISDVYSATTQESHGRHTDHPCVPCVASVATLIVLESTLGLAPRPTDTMTRSGASDTRGWMRPRERPDDAFLRKLDDAAIFRALINSSGRWARDSERTMGERFGTQALTYYMSAK